MRYILQCPSGDILKLHSCMEIYKKNYIHSWRASDSPPVTLMINSTTLARSQHNADQRLLSQTCPYQHQRGSPSCQENSPNCRPFSPLEICSLGQPFQQMKSLADTFAMLKQFCRRCELHVCSFHICNSLS